MDHLDINKIIYQSTHQIPRISASDVAAIASYHNYKSIDNMIDKYLYQDCANLQHLDSINYGIDYVSDIKEMNNIIHKLPNNNQIILDDIQDIIVKRKNEINNVNVCENLLNHVKNVFDDQNVINVLTKDEINFACEYLRSSVHTGWYSNF